MTPDTWCASMTNHISLRLAWHDNGWNGRVCNNPQNNAKYCAGNMSLLSPRIQKLIDVELEQKYKNSKVGELYKKEKYVPPCWWSINLSGETDFELEDPHPYAYSNKKFGADFKRRVPALKLTVKKTAAWTWNFKLSFNRSKNDAQKYRPEPLVRKMVKEYIEQMKSGGSIVFFYANYSNPVAGYTGNDDRYVLLGAGLIKNVGEPEEYSIPEDLLIKVREGKGMKNFPTIAWQFQVELDPASLILLPYATYLEPLNENLAQDKSGDLKRLKEVTIPITETSLTPKFKWVSKTLSNDDALYLLYLLKRALKKIGEHSLINYAMLEDLKRKVDVLLKEGWDTRGAYPGFATAVRMFLKNDFDHQILDELIPKMQKYISDTYGDTVTFFKALPNIEKSSQYDEVNRAILILKSSTEEIKFLSQFDLSIAQLEAIKELYNNISLTEIKRNPYIILEKAKVKSNEEVDQETVDINIYNIDMALIPDFTYANWPATYSATSPERIRALISKILYDAAITDGNSCMLRNEISDKIKEYPLYYIADQKGLDLDASKLIGYEKSPLFKENLFITENIRNQSAVYQLKTIRKIEQIVEDAAKKMQDKKYELSDKDERYISEFMNADHKLFDSRLLDQNQKKTMDAERRKLYRGVLSQGLFLLSGRAGSGKTSAVVNIIKKFSKDMNGQIFVFTPTGKANLIIKDRLVKAGIQNPNIKVSTIHWFLYNGLRDYFKDYNPSPEARQKISKLSNLVGKILSEKLDIEALLEFERRAKEARFKPKILIIDEASMVDEVLLAMLFSLVDMDRLEHLILVGDEKQLAPIGLGRPFIDFLFHMKNRSMESNYIKLESNLRFNPNSTLGILSEIFSEDKTPCISEIDSTLNKKDSTMELIYFSNRDNLKAKLKSLLIKINGTSKDGKISELFSHIFEGDGGAPDLEKVQILTPRRVGEFGSWSINMNIVKNNSMQFENRSKIICEKNIYFTPDGQKGRVLGLANGSIGYIRDGQLYFSELNELQREYPNIYNLRKTLYSKVFGFELSSSDSDMDLGYAITIHKAQGSDFDHVILIISEFSSFIVRELLYTAVTRPKQKLYLLVHEDLKVELANVLTKVYDNSAVEKLHTMLFEYKTAVYKPYQVSLKDGKTIDVRSKAEALIAEALDKLDVDFTYEPEDLLNKYHIRPDFELRVGGTKYYLEHLGLPNNLSYMTRWKQKFDLYKQMEMADYLITTSENPTKSAISANIKQIIDDLMKNTLVTSTGYSNHHYYI